MKREVIVDQARALDIARAAVERANAIPGAHRSRVVDREPRELPWAWAVAVQSQAYVASGDDQHLLIGLGPYLVDKFTGEVIPTGTGTRLHSLERSRGYPSWWDVRGPNSVLELDQ